VRHRIGKRTLQEDFGCYGAKLRSFDVSSEIFQRLVKMRYRRGEVRKNGRTIAPPDEEGAGISQDAVHVVDQLVRGTDLRRCPEVGEFGWRAAERFLGSISESGQEVVE
jgi:hypothetical protein